MSQCRFDLRLDLVENPVRRLDGEALLHDAERRQRRQVKRRVRRVDLRAVVADLKARCRRLLSVGLDLDFVPAVHQPQHFVTAVRRCLRVVDRVVPGRARRDAGEHRRLRQREVFRVLAEVSLGRCLDAVVEAAVRNLVQVPLEDLVFRIALRKLDRVHGLLELALIRALIAVGERDVDVANELLGDRTAARRVGRVGAAKM